MSCTQSSQSFSIIVSYCAKLVEFFCVLPLELFVDVSCCAKLMEFFLFLAMQSLHNFSLSWYAELTKFLYFLLCGVQGVFLCLALKANKFFYCYFLLCKANQAFLFLIVQSLQNFSISYHVELVELLYFLLCRARETSLILQLAFWIGMCTHLFF